MSGRSSCSKLHPERRPGPCAYHNNDHISNRYIHLIQKASDLPDFTNFVSSKYKIAELGCICRKCEDADGCTSSDIHHYTEINVPVFEKAFQFLCIHSFQNTVPVIPFFSSCHSHYNKLNKCINLTVVQCIVCDKCSGMNTGSFKTVSEDKRELITRYFNFDMHVENLICCPYCYDNLNAFSRSDSAEDQLSQTTEYLFSCLEKFTVIDTEKNSQCVHPLHLLYTDIADKFSNSSSTFLSINARLGPGISKDSLRRYITNRCRELEQKQRYILSDSFIVASFDNLDKNQAYSVVCAGKDRSGFQGTTIQTVVPKPSQKINMFDDSNLISNLNQTNIEHDISEVKNSRDSKLEKTIIQKLVNPEDISGLPPVKKQNKFSNMSPSDLDETFAEISEWDEFYTSVTKYGFSKTFFKKKILFYQVLKPFSLFQLKPLKNQIFLQWPFWMKQQTAKKQY
ncbi:unnamed protein product [Mytilus coruscus]|uniref:Uncharacterized protein n=1 Tax=Mytilus coruscus TaxID=42192 RepID=A0A6J8E3T9_MYTCO|nr:unnamed protein product [Mytilus coruscus]